MAKRKVRQMFKKEKVYGAHTPEFRRPFPPPPPRITKESLMSIPDMDYESPIKVCQEEIKTRMDNGVFEVVQSYGISVDKTELAKTLKYDRQQYEKGFRDGVRKFAEMLKEINGLEENELFHNVVNKILIELECEYNEYN